MRKLAFWLGLSAWMAMTSAGHAEDKKAKPAEGKAPTVGAAGVRRDPKGIQGISPYLELIVKGDRAFVARDLDAALALYRDAVKAEPELPLAHYRVGEVHLAKGDQKEAEAAFVNGLRFASRDAALKAKLIFLLADLRERQKNNDEAIGRWKEYAANAAAEKQAITYPGSASERIARNEAWKKNLADS